MALSLMACSPSEGDAEQQAGGGTASAGVGGSAVNEGSGGGGGVGSSGGNGSGSGSSDSGGAGSGGSTMMSGGADSQGTGGRDEGANGGSTAGPSDGRQMTFQIYGFRADRKYISLSARDSTPVGGTSGCERNEVGGCKLSTCSTDGEASTPTLPWYTGEETVTATITQEASEGTKVSTASFVLDPNVEVLSQGLQPRMGFGGDERVQVSIAGGTLPSFELDTEMPLFLVTTTPANDTNDMDQHFIDLSVSEGLTLGWERGVAGVSYYVFGNHSEGELSYSLTCQFDSTLGEGHIDASLLTNLPLGLEFKTVTALQETHEVEGGSYVFLIFDSTVNPDKTRGIGLRLTE